MTHRTTGILYAFLAVLLWSTLGTGYKLTVSQLVGMAIIIGSVFLNVRFGEKAAARGK
jgi:drug/metabolite transporter (DMT)-like permease